MPSPPPFSSFAQMLFLCNQWHRMKTTKCCGHWHEVHNTFCDFFQLFLIVLGSKYFNGSRGEYMWLF